MSVFNDNVLLIHIPKCAGSSAREYLLDYLPNPVDSLSGRTPGHRGGPLPIDSTPLCDITEYTGRPLDSWQKIVIPIRNPYAQVVSHWRYHDRRYAEGGRHIHDWTAASKNMLHNWLTEPHSDFRVWYHTHVRQDMTHEQAMGHVDAIGYYEYWSTVDGEVPPNVEFIRTETMSADFPKAVAAFVTDPGEFPHSNVGDGGDPMSYYTQMSMQIVEHRFRWAFENHYTKVGT